MTSRIPEETISRNNDSGICPCPLIFLNNTLSKYRGPK